MPMAHDIGARWFVQFIPYPVKGWWPLIERGSTQEIEGEYRFGLSVVVRVPRQRAIVIGRWISYRDEEHALALALRARPLTLKSFEESADALAS